jgi:hypothetical protein
VAAGARARRARTAERLIAIATIWLQSDTTETAIVDKPPSAALYTPARPWFEQLQYSQDFSVLNALDETFEGVVRLDTNGLGLDDHNVSVVQDISGNVPVGEQYNIFTFDDVWGEVYNSIGGTPEAFYITPFGDIDIPTWFVEAVGPTCAGARPSGLTPCRTRCSVIHVI